MLRKTKKNTQNKKLCTHVLHWTTSQLGTGDSPSYASLTTAVGEGQYYRKTHDGMRFIGILRDCLYVIRASEHINFHCDESSYYCSRLSMSTCYTDVNEKLWATIIKQSHELFQCPVTARQWVPSRFPIPHMSSMSRGMDRRTISRTDRCKLTPYRAWSSSTTRKKNTDAENLRRLFVCLGHIRFTRWLVRRERCTLPPRVSTTHQLRHRSLTHR